MVEYTKDELFILTNEEMWEMKRQAQTFISFLPENGLHALCVVTFVKQIMEETLHRPVKGIKIIEKR